MIQIYTILIDSLRLLKARKLFWIVLVITGLVGLMYASIGFHETGFSVGFGLKRMENPMVAKGTEFAKLFYILLFTNFLNDWWFGFVALVLALIASCSIFPEMMQEGAIDVMVSKPLSRLKLFLTKYLGVLLFMGVPVLLLCTICFLSIGLRVDVWKPEIFLAVPLLMFVFSLIYCVAVLSGVIWRSTLFALLSASVMWSLCFLLHITETMTYNVVYALPKLGMRVDFATGEQELSGEELEASEGGKKTYAVVRAIGAPFPKTRKATLMLKRLVAFDDELGEFAGIGLVSLMMGQMPDGREQRVAAVIEERMGTGYILWTSAVFELVILSLAAWIFCRRDA